jgi:hypothetical protein
MNVFNCTEDGADECRGVSGERDKRRKEKKE